MPSPSAVNSLPPVRPDRSHEIAVFLERIGWGDAAHTYLAGDASFRRYERVTRGSQHTVLMDAPPPFEDVQPFVHVTQLLKAAGLSAPAIIEADIEEGFLLLEDLGDASFSRVLRQSPQKEPELYDAAMDALLHVQRHAVPEAIAPYDMAVYLREVALFSDWFLPQVLGKEKARLLRADYLSLWRDLGGAGALSTSVLVHRDYHADNLLWLPERDEYKRVGMIDYQDALCGDPFYDVVSLLEDARRDVGAQILERAFQRFLDGSGIADADARARFALLGAQRNLKIIGIFTRLCVRDGKPGYLAFLPRVWAHLHRDLTHPALAPLSAFIARHVPVDAQGIIPVDVSIGSLE